MKIRDMFERGTVFSFEIFPPKKTAPIETIYKVREEALRAFQHVRSLILLRKNTV